MIWLALQDGLKVIGGGAAAIVYEVNEDVVLKACRTYQSPSSDASHRDWWIFADSTLFSLHLSRKEKDFLRLLEKQPHPNIAEAISVDEDEGIYLRRYLPLSQVELPTLQGRVSWYRDFLHGLNHLHGLGICHSDLRPDNILLSRGRHPHALLCDFSGASAFGELNASPFEGEVPRTGLARTVSDATDRFALAYLIFEMETGSKPALAAVPDGTLSLPLVCTGHSGLDCMILKAWWGQYASTSDMLADAESLSVPAEQDGDARSTAEPLVLTGTLRQQVKQWRQRRLDCYGNCIPFRSASYN